MRSAASLNIIPPGDDETLKALISRLARRGVKTAVINSSAAGWISPYLAEEGIAALTLVHELPGIIDAMDLDESLNAALTLSHTTVFPAEFVRRRTAPLVAGLDPARVKIRHQGLYQAAILPGLKDKADRRAHLAARLDLPEEAKVVIAAGFGDHRKGFDIFAEWFKATRKLDNSVHFCWLGGLSPEMQGIADLLRSRMKEPTFHTPGFVDEPTAYLGGADIYALTSREDPFPSGALEAMAGAAPVVLVKGTTGIEELGEEAGLSILPDADPERAARAIMALLENPIRLRARARAARDHMRGRFGFVSYAGDVARMAGIGAPTVSVVVPNYNYAKYLPERLETILGQSIPPDEIIFLDDASTDDSLRVAAPILDAAGVDWSLIRNKTNSGHVFSQWMKGARAARGAFVWIAEADDASEPGFLEGLLDGMVDDDVALGYGQSRQVDALGRTLATDTQDYVSDLHQTKWMASHHAHGTDEIAEYLAVKNVIPNVSAVLFRREGLIAALDRIAPAMGQMRLAGDWLLYIEMLRGARAYYNAEALNRHRHHGRSVTARGRGTDTLAEIAAVQAYAASVAPVSPEVAEEAVQYRISLASRFGLTEADAITAGEGALTRIHTALEGGEPVVTHPARAAAQNQ